MRPDEISYWDNACVMRGWGDNIWKRQEIVRRLMKLDLIGRSVLEIGCGLGTAFGSINVALLQHVDYLGTDLSPRFVSAANRAWKLNTVQAEVTHLPGEDHSYDYVVALDSLEHVRPEDRIAGYKEISRVLKQKGAMVVLNIPLEITLHDKEYDHGFDDSDLFTLLKATDMRLQFYEAYTIIGAEDVPISYAWAIGGR
jgi:ubiquinone/menaquinone biosynthesis C-methylase UbiE